MLYIISLIEKYLQQIVVFVYQKPFPGHNLKNKNLLKNDMLKKPF